MQYVKLQDLVKAGVLKAEWDNKTKITKIIKQGLIPYSFFMEKIML